MKIKIPPYIPSQMVISKEEIDKIYHLEPRRICFSTTHKTSLSYKQGDGYIGKFASIPYTNTIYPIFYKMTGLELFPSKYGTHWRYIKDIEELNKIENFITELKDIIFLRDTLALSIALSINKDEQRNRTEVGELEFQAKSNDDENATRQLADRCMEICKKLPYYNDVTTFCAVPPSKNGERNLPNKIVSIIEDKFKINNISNKLCWNNTKKPLKDVYVNEKWSELENANLCVNGDLTDKIIILVDDLYQSGMTMQYVAMKLQQAGAGKIYGIALVKSWRNTDNQ
jgi:hypothetical protein